jgi:hypothetical protein
MEKKSLINTLKTTKKVNVITAPAKNEGTTSRKAVKKAAMNHARKAGVRHLRAIS